MIGPAQGMPPEVRERAARVEALVLDVDGVFTDGKLIYGPDGENTKTFHVHDGFGVKLLLGQSVTVAIISARSSAALSRRLDELGVEHRYTGRGDKLTALHELCGQLGVDPDRVAYVGDDALDVPVMRAVGLPIAVANAHVTARTAAAWVTSRSGGDAAVREVADALLEARGQLQEAYAFTLKEEAGTDRGSPT